MAVPFVPAPPSRNSSTTAESAAESSCKTDYTVAFKFGDKLHAMEIRRSVAEFHEDFGGTAGVTIGLTKDMFLGVIMGKVDFADATEKGLITVTGDASVVPKFFSSFDKPTDRPVLTVR